MKIETFKKIYKHDRFINFCELFMPVFIMPVSKIAGLMGVPALSTPAALWVGATLLSSLVASSYFGIKNSDKGRLRPYSGFEGYISHYIDKLFISKNKQIFNAVMKKSQQLCQENNYLISNSELKQTVLFSLMKILTACGVDRKDTWWAFYSLNQENMEEYSNFFIGEESNVEKKICNKMKALPDFLVQNIFDSCIEEIGEDMGARFYLIHQHHNIDFYEVMKKISFNFSSEDKMMARDFVERAKNDDLNSSQYLSYGSLLNDDLIKRLVDQQDVPDEILDYLMFSNDNILLNSDLIDKIKEIKIARHEKKMLLNLIDEVVPLKLKHNSKISGSANIPWDADRTLELPKSAIFKV